MNSTEVLGVRLNIFNDYKETYNNLLLIMESCPAMVTVNNVHTIVTGFRNKYYMDALNTSELSLADGKPISILAGKNAGIKSSRIFGPLFFEKCLNWGQESELKHFFFGSSEKTIEKMRTNILQLYPKVRIVGTYSPPFKNKFTEKDNTEFIINMNESGADIFWIGLGAPKQEIWMYENYKKLNHGVMIGIGAGFDYLAGNIKHAPEWMKNASLEWLYRLWQEPRRLWKRYLVYNSLFIYFVLIDLIKGMFKRKR